LPEVPAPLSVGIGAVLALWAWITRIAAAIMLVPAGVSLAAAIS
jgi:hypothetical protein